MRLSSFFNQGGRAALRTVFAVVLLGAFGIGSASGFPRIGPIPVPAPSAGLVITHRPAAYVRTRTAHFSWHAKGKTRGVCRRDENHGQSCPTSVIYHNLNQGLHSFSVSVSTNDRVSTKKVNWKVDVTPPTPPVVSGGSAAWVTVPTQISASGSVDSGSGVAEYQSRQSTTRGASWTQTATGASVTVSQDGTTWVQFRAVDRAGNISAWAPTTEPSAPATVQLDNDPPSAPVLTGGGSSWSNAAQVDVTASGSVDALSNSVTYQYQTSADGGLTWTSWVPGTDATISAEGQTLVRFEALDGLGNTTSPVQTSVHLDRVAPTAPQVWGGSASWVTLPTTVWAGSSTDSASGVASYQYRESTDSGVTWSQPAAGANVTVSQNGTTWLQFRAVDAAGNASDWAPSTVPDPSSTVNLDLPPSVPTLSGGGGPWSNAAQVDVIASGSTASSGPVTYQYQTSADGGATWTGWTAGNDATVTAEGQTLVRFEALDALGDTSSPVQIGVLLDRTAPTAPLVWGGSASWVTAPTTVSAAGSLDSGSGVASYQYRASIDNGATWSPVSTGSGDTVSQNGTTWVQFRAVDAAGNASAWTPSTVPDPSSTVELDNTPPTAPTLTGGGSTWSNAAQVDVTASGSVDSLSNPVTYQFQTSTNGGTTWTAWTAGADAAVTAEGQTLVRFEALDTLGNASSPAQTSVLLDRTPPAVAVTSPSSGASVSGSVSLSATATSTAPVQRVDFLVDGSVVGSATSAPYTVSWNSGSVAAGAHTVTARAVDAAGNQGTSAPVSISVVSAVSYFTTLPSGASGLPRSDSYCAGQVTTDPWEPRTDNYTANHTMPSLPVNWSNADVGSYWSRWITNRNLVTGHYTGTTNQIIQWSACKWGLDENLMRAVAVQESDWHMSMVGDKCGPVGEASYGLFQIKNAYCNGGGAWGGYPATAQNTALNADFYGAYIRSCIDNAFYDGGSWLYNGQTIAQITAAHGFDYAVWGCVGSWYSGGWYDSGAVNYINGVKSHLANKDWLGY